MGPPQAPLLNLTHPWCPVTGEQDPEMLSPAGRCLIGSRIKQDNKNFSNGILNNKTFDCHYKNNNNEGTHIRDHDNSEFSNLGQKNPIIKESPLPSETKELLLLQAHAEYRHKDGTIRKGRI